MMTSEQSAVGQAIGLCRLSTARSDRPRKTMACPTLACKGVLGGLVDPYRYSLGRVVSGFRIVSAPKKLYALPVGASGRKSDFHH